MGIGWRLCLCGNGFLSVKSDSDVIQTDNIFSLQAGQPLAITGGIGEALIATATGLLVAILALIVHSYFSQKMDAVLTAMDSACAIVNSEFRKRRQGNAV